MFLKVNVCMFSKVVFVLFLLLFYSSKVTLEPPKFFSDFNSYYSVLIFNYVIQFWLKIPPQTSNAIISGTSKEDMVPYLGSCHISVKKCRSDLAAVALKCKSDHDSSRTNLFSVVSED